MAHTQIGPSEWLVVARLLKAGYGIRAIAEAIGKDHSAVFRHVRTNGGRDGYDVREVRRQKAHAAHCSHGGHSCAARHPAAHRQLLKEHQSPEQIAGVLKCVSASTIYRYIHERAPHLKQFLRSKKGKYRRRRGTKMR